jgi:hypothetical protein
VEEQSQSKWACEPLVHLGEYTEAEWNHPQPFQVQDSPLKSCKSQVLDLDLKLASQKLLVASSSCRDEAALSKTFHGSKRCGPSPV